jgi:hypothetical protein
MFLKTIYKPAVIVILLASCIAGCNSGTVAPVVFSTPAISGNPTILPTSTIIAAVTPRLPSPTFALSDYAFPSSIDPAKSYLFYLHGKIIEDQGLPAISPDFGEYEYADILAKLSRYGFVVISEVRPKNTDGLKYASKIAVQVKALLKLGVPAKNITVVGASQGAGVAISVSNLLENNNMNFVLLAICAPDTVQEFIQNQIFLYGNVLSIYDSSDKLAGSCQELFSASEGKGLSNHSEIILHVGTGHGILYKPLDEWIIPAVQWARKP